MRVSAAKSAPRVERNLYIRQKGIKSYGDGNDYPQKVLQILASSGTGSVCYNIYTKFVEGGGFRDKTFAETVINDQGERVSFLLTKCAKDLRAFNGFALLIKYNFLGQATEYYNVPFEHCRLAVDADKNLTNKIAVHPDWTGMTGKRFEYKDIKLVNRYDPATILDEIIEAFSPEFYAGQIYYFTADGDFDYPVSPFDPVITDMLTEESVSTVKHRNAKFNFLPAGMIVRKGIKPVTTANGEIDMTDPVNKRVKESGDGLLAMQGDMNTAKMVVVDVDADEEKPEFVPFEAKNYDQQFKYTEPTIQDNIGRMFMMPPVLRGVDVGTGFGAELIENAYNFMNSVVSDERRKLSMAFKDVFAVYLTQFTDFEIEPIKYVTNDTTNQQE